MVSCGDRKCGDYENCRRKPGTQSCTPPLPVTRRTVANSTPERKEARANLLEKTVANPPQSSRVRTLPGSEWSKYGRADHCRCGSEEWDSTVVVWFTVVVPFLRVRSTDRSQVSASGTQGWIRCRRWSWKRITIQGRVCFVCSTVVPVPTRLSTMDYDRPMVFPYHCYQYERKNCTVHIVHGNVFLPPLPGHPSLCMILL